MTVLGGSQITDPSTAKAMTFSYLRLFTEWRDGAMQWAD